MQRVMLSALVLVLCAAAVSMNAGEAVAQAAARVVPKSEQQLQLSFAPVVRRTAPAVVNIYSKRKVRNPFANDPLFGRFWGDSERTQQSLGSGVIVRQDEIGRAHV